MSYRNDLWCEAFRNNSSPWRHLFRKGSLSSPPWGPALMPPHLPVSLSLNCLAQASFQGLHIFQLVPCSCWLTHPPPAPDRNSPGSLSFVYGLSIFAPMVRTHRGQQQLQPHKEQSDPRAPSRLTAYLQLETDLQAPLECIFSIVKVVSLFFKLYPWLSTN